MTRNVREIQKDITRLKSELKVLEEELSSAKERQIIRCRYCGGRRAIGKLIIYQDHRYYYVEGEWEETQRFVKCYKCERRIDIGDREDIRWSGKEQVTIYDGKLVGSQERI